MPRRRLRPRRGGIRPDEVDLIIANDFINRVYTLRFGDRVHWIGHHLSHAASTFYTSPFEQAAVLVMDGRGSEVGTAQQRRGETITHYTGDAAGLHMVHAVNGRVAAAARRLDDEYEDSVGGMYEAVSKAIGFHTVGGMGAPGKTMGLAPYGSPRYVEDVAARYRLADGEFRQSTAERDALCSLIKAELARAGDGPGTDEIRADFAFAVQANTERIVLELVRWLHRRTGLRTLCLAGGVALNSVANFKILQDTPIEEIHIVPAAGDHGTALGAALHGHYGVAGNPWTPAPTPFSPYLGREYDDADVKGALAPHAERIRVERPDDVLHRTAQALARGEVVGWFQGRSEIGPRALGNRSILADPRNPDMKDRINAKVKHREPFRPFAPVVPLDRQADWFESAVPARYMLLVPQVRADRRQCIPAVTHVDGSARLQSVVADLNPRLYGLLGAFERLTGVPVLLNTSFNDNEEPIVETPADAVRCFLSTDLDMLVLGDTVITKDHNR